MKNYHSKITFIKVKKAIHAKTDRKSGFDSKSKCPGNMNFVNIQLKTDVFQAANLLFKLILQLDFQKQFSTWERKN